ncbi:methylmalonyl-CoA epimerase [Alkalibacillus salilacus]|uniref:Methylmalonyl-CoA epimerase n=1 Tax=Alkalibacillus salilacus TaxID=284582 RepID=A0ABT9VC62_9BACI|nr:methylmalonyl-CoA epimerase [Alkalibacillus salilacus]MDQ0158559.1 methylmalonyl-CoA epimerase [Alkalibacillus salilacus]
MNKIAHIGIAVKSLDEMIPFYRDQLGLTFEGKEQVNSEQVHVAFFKIGESAIELLEPLSEESPIAKYIEKKGEGIHHIAFDVDDVQKRLNHLKSEGIPLIHEKPKTGAHDSQVAFLHPKAANGVLFELCQQK